MCGIAGAFRIDGERAATARPAVLRAMTDVIEYRGPDDAGYVDGDGCSLGRPAPVDHRRRGRPPAVRERDAAAIWAAQNGEIYNHDELRAA